MKKPENSSFRRSSEWVRIKLAEILKSRVLRIGEISDAAGDDFAFVRTAIEQELVDLMRGDVVDDATDRLRFEEPVRTSKRPLAISTLSLAVICRRYVDPVVAQGQKTWQVALSDLAGSLVIRYRGPNEPRIHCEHSYPSVDQGMISDNPLTDGTGASRPGLRFCRVKPSFQEEEPWPAALPSTVQGDLSSN